MCWCNPNIRTPNCGRPGCHPPVTHKQALQAVITDMALAQRGEICPMCGKDGAHVHTPQEVTIYGNGIKLGMAHSLAQHVNRRLDEAIDAARGIGGEPE